MTEFLLAVFFVFGAIVGSFLNVVIYRLHTGKTLRGRSHCLSCGEELRWYELVPLVSYLILRARCRNCHARIPSRYFSVELFTGLSYALLWHLFGGDLVLVVLYVLLASLLIVVAVYDLRHTIIPDELSILVGIVAVAFVAHSVYLTQSYQLITTHTLSGLGGALFMGSLWYISKGRWMGLGDAKLALPLGFIVGFPGIFNMIILSFWVGAAVSIGLLILQVIIRKGTTNLRYLSVPLTMKSEVPFAPFLIVGFVLVQFFHADIFDITFWFASTL